MLPQPPREAGALLCTLIRGASSDWQVVRTRPDSSSFHRGDTRRLQRDAHSGFTEDRGARCLPGAPPEHGFSPSTPRPPLFALQGTRLDLWVISHTTIKNNCFQKAHSISCRKSQFKIKYNCHLVPFAVVPSLLRAQHPGGSPRGRLLASGCLCSFLPLPSLLAFLGTPGARHRARPCGLQVENEINSILFSRTLKCTGEACRLSEFRNSGG